MNLHFTFKASFAIYGHCSFNTSSNFPIILTCIYVIIKQAKKQFFKIISETSKINSLKALDKNISIYKKQK